MAVPYHEADAHSTPSPPSPPNSTTNKWGPYSSAGDFTANMIITLAVLFCVLLLVLAINAVIRFLLCNRRHSPSDDPEKQASRRKEAASQAEGLPTVVFSPGTKLAGEETECAICLVEFLEGDGIRVLPACNHGFHVRCIERWLATRRSCPTCRASFHEAAPGKGKAEEA